MKSGIGLPANIPGVSRDSVLEWARKADSGPFSSVGIIDRVVYPNWDPLVALAAAAAVTQRVRLMTTILIAPVRDATLLAKQAAMSYLAVGLLWVSEWAAERTITQQFRAGLAVGAGVLKSNWR